MFKYIYKIGLVILSLTMFTACNDDNGPEDIFGEDANTRLEKEADELRTLLKSSPEGWKMTYFTDDPRYTDNAQQLGGWNFIFKMTDDKNVTMVSDYSAETLVPKTSEYQIILGSVTKLSFATKNHIHVLSDAVNYPFSGLSGKGYKGDFEFLYYGQEGEDIILRSNRFQIKIRLTKATAQDWTDLQAISNNLAPLASAGNLEVIINNNGEITTHSDYSYLSAARFVTNTVNPDLSFGVAPTLNGLKAVKPIKINDNLEAIDFTFDSANNNYVANFENSSVTINLGDPILVSDIVNEYYFGVLATSGHPINDSSDSFITTFIDTRDTLEQQTALSIYGFFIVPDFGFVQYILIDDQGDDTRVNRLISNYSVNDATGTLTLVDGGWQNAADSTYDALQPINDILFDAQGLKVTPTGAFYDGAPVFFLENNSGFTIGSHGITY